MRESSYVQADVERMNRELKNMTPVSENLYAALSSLQLTTEAVNDKIRNMGDSPAKYRTAYLASLMTQPNAWIPLVSALDKLRAYEMPDLFFVFDTIFFVGADDPIFPPEMSELTANQDLRVRVPWVFSLLIAAGYCAYVEAIRDMEAAGRGGIVNTPAIQRLSATKANHVGYLFSQADQLMATHRELWPGSLYDALRESITSIAHYSRLAVDPETVQDNGGIASTYAARVLKSLLTYINVKKSLAPMAVTMKDRNVLEHASVTKEAVAGMMVPLDPKSTLTNNSHVEILDTYDAYGAFTVPMGAKISFAPFRCNRGDYYLPPGNLFLTTAPSGHGKSYHMCNHVAQLSVYEQLTQPAAYYSYELSAYLLQQRITGCELNGWLRRCSQEYAIYGKCLADNEMTQYFMKYIDEIGKYDYVSQLKISTCADLSSAVAETSPVTAGFLTAYTAYKRRCIADRRNFVRTVDANRMSLPDVDGHVQMLQDAYDGLSVVYLDWLNLIPTGRGFGKPNQANQQSWERAESLAYDIVDYAKSSWNAVAVTATQGSRSSLTEMTLGMEGTAYGLYTWNPVSLGVSFVLPFHCQATLAGNRRCREPFTVRVGFAEIPKSRLYDTPSSTFVYLCDFVHGMTYAYPYGSAELDDVAERTKGRKNAAGQGLKQKHRAAEALVRRVLFKDQDHKSGVIGDYFLDFSATTRASGQGSFVEDDESDAIDATEYQPQDDPPQRRRAPREERPPRQPREPRRKKTDEFGMDGPPMSNEDFLSE